MAGRQAAGSDARKNGEDAMSEIIPLVVVALIVGGALAVFLATTKALDHITDDDRDEPTETIETRARTAGE